MAKKKASPTDKPTLGGPAAVDSAAAARRGQRTIETLPDAPGGQVFLYALQPEQIPGVRKRLAALGVQGAEQVKLPHQDKRARQVLAHTVQIAARHDHTRRLPGLMFPGADGLQRLLQLDDGRLAALARAVVRLNKVYANDDDDIGEGAG